MTKVIDLISYALLAASFHFWFVYFHGKTLCDTPLLVGILSLTQVLLTKANGI